MESLQLASRCRLINCSGTSREQIGLCLRALNENNQNHKALRDSRRVNLPSDCIDWTCTSVKTQQKKKYSHNLTCAGTGHRPDEL
jgi:hypothetical protein